MRQRLEAALATCSGKTAAPDCLYLPASAIYPTFGNASTVLSATVLDLCDHGSVLSEAMIKEGAGPSRALNYYASPTTAHNATLLPCEKRLITNVRWQI